MHAPHHQFHSCKTILAAVVSLVFVMSFFAQAAEPPTPTAEHKKLEVWAGRWQYSGETKAGPLGPAGTFKGERTGRMILNGFFLENTWRENGSMGDTKGVEIVEYDSATRTYVFSAFGDDGSSVRGPSNTQGTNWTSKFSLTDPKGVTHQMKVVWKFSSDGASCEFAGDISDDAKTWNLLYTGRMTKIKDDKGQ